MNEFEDPDVFTNGHEVAELSEEPLSTDDSLILRRNQTGSEPMDTAEQLGLDRSRQDEQLADGIRLQDEMFEAQDGSGGVDELPSPANSEGNDSVMGNKPPLPKDRVSLPTRPGLTRESSAPPRQPLRPAPLSAEAPQDPPDSLTLAELRRIRNGFPNAEAPKQQPLTMQQVYDFEYKDAQAFPIEIEEWFSYSEGERAKLLGLASAYSYAWTRYIAGRQEDVGDWSESQDKAQGFLQEQLTEIRSDSEDRRVAALQVLCYLTLGVWNETAGTHLDNPFWEVSVGKDHAYAQIPAGYEGTGSQVYWMIRNVCALIRMGALPILFDLMKSTCDHELAASLQATDDTNGAPPVFNDNDVRNELWCILTLLYVIFEVARLADDTTDAMMLEDELLPWKTRFLNLCTQIVAQMRWDESAPIPQSKVFLLLWKVILLCFGGIEEVEEVKRHFQDGEEEKDTRGQPIITASPLDYHLFRQEISSKYPAYQPPQPLFPFEPESNTILPPLQHRQSRYEEPVATNGASSGINGHSIMHQPVHIATPAPSPPPSPAGPGGKGGKKQNYQTNQMFPFLYPPLDPLSNEIGGKGSTELQDALVGKKWHGSDIPASILEAAELFAQRMRATRGMKQLWEARVDYMVYERGWKEGQDDDVEEELRLEDHEGDHEPDTVHRKAHGTDAKSLAEERLSSVEAYYRESLPLMQSVVIVLLKAILKNVTDLVAAAGARNGSQGGLQEPNSAPQGSSFEYEYQNGADHTGEAAEQVENTRTQEIAGEALSAILLLLLKWLKVSRKSSSKRR